MSKCKSKSKSSKGDGEGEGEGEHRHHDEDFCFYHSVSCRSVFGAEFSLRSKRGGGGCFSLRGGISIVFPFSTSPTAYWCRSATTTFTSSVLSCLGLATVFMRRPKLPTDWRCGRGTEDDSISD